MNNVIAISLWGDKPKYLQGAIENCKLAKLIYPEWKLRFYIDQSITVDFARQLKDEGAGVYQVADNKGSFYGMYWRFWTNDDPTVDRYIIRDSDSRLNYREQAAVDEWILSKKKFHIMRDHPHHRYPIMGGLWGCVRGAIPNMAGLIEQWNSYDRYCCDQDFLAYVIYPLVKHDALVHDTHIEKKPFPPHKELLYNGTFVGQIYDENNVPEL